jgi:hypothetical protein
VRIGDGVSGLIQAAERNLGFQSLIDRYISEQVDAPIEQRGSTLYALGGVVV